MSLVNDVDDVDDVDDMDEARGLSFRISLTSHLIPSHRAKMCTKLTLYHDERSDEALSPTN